MVVFLSLSPTHLHSIISVFFILILVPASFCQDDPDYNRCVEPSENCGNLGPISYPFWSSDSRRLCGHEAFRLSSCEPGRDPVLVTSVLQEIHVRTVNQFSSLMTIVIPMNSFGDKCPPNHSVPMALNDSYFSYCPGFENISLLFDCSTPIGEHKLSCSLNQEEINASWVTDDYLRDNGIDLKQCRFTWKVPVPKEAIGSLKGGWAELQRVFEWGFNVSYEKAVSNCRQCQDSNGMCGTNLTNSQFTCLCPDQPHPSDCNDGYGEQEADNQWNVQRKVIVSVVTASVSVVIMCIIFFLYLRRKKYQYAPSSFVPRSISSNPSSKSDFEKGGNYYGVHLFTYDELEEATNNFDSSQELGDGGFGTVYYGKLRDGRAVAVKRLYENNLKRVEQFMNEVEILTRLLHQHLVLLYGCTSRHSRELLLVYEFIPNGTVADHLHGESAKPGALPWPTRMKIAIETASALAYLHASDIIHRDVKTNNILLDQNFCVKVADFGLSRLFPTDVTHISTAPQGTPGYVDPEYHECYQLTSKSDVYSFGVVLIELISSLPAVDITRHRHEINLSNMAINKIQSGELHKLVDPTLGFESDNRLRKMITAVAELAFQCLQGAKDLRPSMEEVWKSLEDINKTKEMDITSDEAALLKSCSLTFSPVSVTVKWPSTSTTPNASG